MPLPSQPIIRDRRVKISRGAWDLVLSGVAACLLFNYLLGSITHDEVLSFLGMLVDYDSKDSCVPHMSYDAGKSYIHGNEKVGTSGHRFSFPFQRLGACGPWKKKHDNESFVRSFVHWSGRHVIIWWPRVISHFRYELLLHPIWQRFSNQRRTWRSPDGPCH